MSTLTIKVLNPKAETILDSLASVGLIEVGPLKTNDSHYLGVFVSTDEWRSIQETLYLLSVPGMRESIREGLQTPLAECSESVWSENKR